MTNHVCLFDTETNGKPKSYKAPTSRVDNWPRVTELAWRVVTTEGELVKAQCHLIRPDGWEIPRDKFFLDNNMTTERCAAEGIPIADAAGEFLGDLQDCEWLAAHNLAFDRPVLGAEFVRLGLTSQRRPQGICTMEMSTLLCRIPHDGRKQWTADRDRSYKWPKLEELYWTLFNEKLENTHAAGGDTLGLDRCFFELVRRGVITLALKAGQP